MSPHNKPWKTGVTLVFLTLLMMCAGPLWALDVPPLKGHVNDYAGMLTSASQRQLEAVLTDFERQESTQIVVLTIPTLDGNVLEDFSMRVAEAWKIGQAGSDNGAILLIAKKDRKIRIEVGYGLEGRLTDLTSGRIIRNVITPYFRSGQFDQGITQGVGAMIEAVKGEFSAADKARQPRTAPARKGAPVFAIVGLLFLVNALGRASRVMGAAGGAVLFPIAGALFFGAAPMLLVGLIPIGLLAGLILGRIGGPLSGSLGSRSHRGGGYWGGGFGGGGGFSSGGGFGGFSGGGGGFGGGGASGGW